VQAAGVKSGSAVPLDVRRKFRRRQPQASHVDAMRTGARVARQAVSATPQQARGTASIAAQRVRKADGELGQSLPQVALARRRGFPRRLKHLVRVERAIGVNQFLGGCQRLQRRPGPVVGWRLADCIPGQRAAKCVPRPRIPRPPGGIAISAGEHS
jgi:hypothetical protein